MTANPRIRSRLTLICYACLGLCMPSAITQYSMAAQELAAALGRDTQVVLLTDSLRAVCLVAALFISGYASRFLGRRRTICLGLAMQVAPQFLIPWAVGTGSLPLLFVCKGMQGLNAVAFPVYLAVIMQTAPPGSVGLYTAVFNGSFVAGAGAGAWLAGQIIPAFGWRASFYAIGVLCLFFAIPALAVTPSEQGTTSANAGALPKGAAPADASAPTEATMLPDKRQRRPLYASLMRSPVTWLLTLALSANTWVMQAVTVDMAVYTSAIGLPYSGTGALMFMISVVTVASSIIGGALSDFVASRSAHPLRVRARVMATGCLLCAVAALGLVFTASAGVLLVVSSGLMVFGISWAGGAFWPLPPLVYTEEDAAASAAFCSGASNIVNPLAPLTVGVLLGSAGLWPLGWLTCSIAGVLGFTAAVAIPRCAKH